MDFASLLAIVGDEPVFETGLLLAGDVDPMDVRRQLSRWTASGKLFQLRRGLYALAPPYQRTKPHPFVVANRLVPASYVSGVSALAHHGLIPEYVPVTVSATTARPQRRPSPFGVLEFRHLKTGLFWGSRLEDLGGGQHARVATPEKALLDTIHLTSGGSAEAEIREMRLQNLDRLDLDALAIGARRARSPKLTRAVRVIAAIAGEEIAENLADGDADGRP